MARIFLEAGDNDFIIANNGSKVFGSHAFESIVINSNLSGIQLDSLIEGVRIIGNSSDFTYQSAGAGLKVFKGNDQMALLAANANTTVIFNNGAVKLTMSTITGDVYLGQTIVPTNMNVDIVPTNLFKLPVKECLCLKQFAENHDEPIALNMGENVSGLMYGREKDSFAVKLISDQRYEFNVLDKGINRPVFAIYDSSNLLLTKQVGNAPLTFRPTESGTYFLTVEEESLTANYLYTISADYERFQYTLNFTNPSFFGENYNEISANIGVAIDQWATKFIQTGNRSATIDINVSAMDSHQLGLSALAAGNSLISVDSGEIYNEKSIFYSGVQHEILTGVDLNALEEDVCIMINLDLLSKLWFDPTLNDRHDNAPERGEYDFVGVVMHEFAHGLGFNGFLAYSPPPNGEQGLKNSYDFGVGSFDRFIQWNDDLQWFEFTGSKTDQIYHQLGFEGHLPLYSKGNVMGSDLYHYSNVNPDGVENLDGYLMTAVATPEESMTISALDTAMLQDVGYLIG